MLKAGVSAVGRCFSRVSSLLLLVSLLCLLLTIRLDPSWLLKREPTYACSHSFPSLGILGLDPSPPLSFDTPECAFGFASPWGPASC